MPEQVQFFGKLVIDFIKTDNHPTQIFDVEGTLSSSTGHDLDVNVTGSLNHLYSDTNIACWLNIAMVLNQQHIKDFL